MAFCLGAFGCGNAARQPPIDPTTEEAQTQLVQGLPAVHLERVREIDLAAHHARNRRLLDSGVKRGTLPRSTEFDDGDLVQIDRDGRATLLRYNQRELEAFGREATKLGLNEPSSAPAGDGARASAAGPGDADDDFTDFVPKGWSNGVDNRTPRFISSTYPAGESGLRRVGFLSISNGDTGDYLGNGSGALVGRRLVLSVAHAVIHPDSINYRYDFAPRMDGPGVFPYGVETADSYQVPSQFLANNCSSSYDHWNCPQWDWAVLILRSNAWSGVPSPGWMGYQSTSEATLSSYTVLHAGYPICGYSDSPVGCQDFRPYGSTGVIKYFNHPGGSTNVNLIMRHNHGTSVGHSGAPLYNYRNGAGPYVLGVWNVYLCHQCASPAEIDSTLGPSYPEYLTYPNLARRIDLDLFNTLQSLRSQYP